MLEPIIGDRVYLGDLSALNNNEIDDRFHFFAVGNDFDYVPFCDDFGPLNLATTLRFVKVIVCKLMEHPNRAIVYCVNTSDKRDLTNAVFLLGAYMILEVGLCPAVVGSCFSSITSQLTPYRDATYVDCDFKLTVLDCWSGLSRATKLGWVSSYDLQEYEHYDNPLEGDLHFIVPDKLIAFRGPRSLPGSKVYLDMEGRRYFSPKFYVEPFHDMCVSTVIRLNEGQYNEKEFTDHGFECVGMEFEDCTAPPPEIVQRFLHTVRSAKGAVAVHCKAGLGRTGTLIATYAMSEHGFSAREAIAWARIVRPGSIIGEQQHFLTYLEEVRRVPNLRRASDDSQIDFASKNRLLCCTQAEQMAEALHAPERTFLKVRQAKAAREHGRHHPAHEAELRCGTEELRAHRAP